MTPATSLMDYRVITAEEAEQRFSVSAHIQHPFQDFDDEQEIRLYESGLRVEGAIRPESDGDWVPYNVIVAGDLTVTGDIDWWDHGSGNFLLVTGNARARNMVLLGCPEVAVRGDLTLTGGIHGSYGDNGGVLAVKGHVRAEFVISTSYFCMSFSGQPEALLVADPYRVNCPVDFEDDELIDIALPEVMGKDGTPDERLIHTAMRAGHPVLPAGLRPSHLAVLDELRESLPRAREVTELDLSGRKLRELPVELLEYSNLRVLSLAGNDSLGGAATTGERLEALSALANLEELNLASTGLTGLPDAIGALRSLRVLDISGNAFESLPERIGELSTLEVLRAARLSCPVPEGLGRLTGLRELDLSSLQPGDYKSRVEFPMAVTRLTGLRRLDLSHVWLTTVPDDLLALTELEELDLGGSLSAILPGLPRLDRLPRLKVLRVNGSTPWSFQPEPPRELLDHIWAITTLEHLEIDRWGEKSAAGRVRRPGLTELPDDAFARMPGLRRLDLAFNDLTTLPESFFGLRHLESVDLRYVELDEPTLERLRADFPDLRARPGDG
ncbi:leucine-rich repeat domain-containing protein [Nocardia sp. NBC_01377]|uniref:leucine-rich repeat domain-containing protein n=1 Tax=Nocardia sp. NBC_01377 TaxID=2903595 RepID=UPI0032483463